MKLIVPAAAFALLATPASADPCFTSFDPGGAGSNIVVSFLDMVAAPDAGVACDVTTDAVVLNDDPSAPDDAIFAYSSEYRVDSATGDTIHLETTANGITRIATVPGNDDDSSYIRNYTGVIKGDALQSDIEFNVDSPVDNTAELVSLDYNFLGYTTLDEQAASLDQVSGAQTAVVTHLNTTAGLVVGANQPLEREDQVGVFGAVGSHTVGVTGRYNLGDGFSIDGGAALFEQSVGGATSSGVLLGGKASYLQPEDGGAFRVLGNTGLTLAPNMSMSFSRGYTLYGAGGDFSDVPVTANATGNGTMVGIWLEGGVLVAPAPDNEIIFSASYARNWLNFGSLSEEQTDANPFAFSSGGTSTFDTLKAKAAWTTAVAADVDVTLHAAVGQVIASDLTGDVALVGSLTVGGQDETFAEYGARIDWQVTEMAQVGLFALGSTGSVTGTHFQVGAAAGMKF